MSAHSAESVQKQIKLYLLIGAALLVGTAVTVGVYYIHFSLLVAIIVALIIASIKGWLVAGYFMHLSNERKLIYLVLVMTVFFTFGMVVLTKWAYRDQQGSHYGAFQVTPKRVIPAAAAHSGH